MRDRQHARPRVSPVAEASVPAEAFEHDPAGTEACCYAAAKNAANRCAAYV